MKRLIWPLMFLFWLPGCGTLPERPPHTVESLDLDRFMGSWFVIAHIPLWPERNAWNGVEHYQRLDERKILTTFTFRQGAADGELKRYQPIAFVEDDSGNAIWEMQFLWPFRADFRVVWLSGDYQHTIIGRKKRDHAWIMARQAQISEADYREMVQYLRVQGYPVEALRRMPQQWPGEPGYASQPGD